MTESLMFWTRLNVNVLEEDAVKMIHLKCQIILVYGIFVTCKFLNMFLMTFQKLA